MGAWFSHIFTIISPMELMGMLLIFFMGYTIAPFVIKLNHKIKMFTWLTRYAELMSRLLDELLKKEWTFLPLFLFIFIFNLTSVFTGFLSGFIPYLPYLLLGYTGLNISLVLLLKDSEGNLLLNILNPVALLEIPAICIAYTLSLKLKITSLSLLNIKLSALTFQSLLPVMVLYPVLIFFIAALIETSLIISMRKMKAYLGED
ncbi:MAG: hypothetical protein Kow00108_03120 [Calditrichia bacterium]